MSRNDDESSRYRNRDERIREHNLRDPYESRREVRSYRDAEDAASWQANYPGRHAEGPRDPRWDEQPARYGGGYRDDESAWPRSRQARGDARPDAYAGRRFVEGYRNEDDRHRAHGYGRDDAAWLADAGDHRQSNSGYDSERSYGQGNERDDARSNLSHASWTQEHDYQGPRYGAGSHRSPPGRGDEGSQYARTDTYGGAGFRQQGKRYWFDEGDQRDRYRGTQPRGYERSDDRLRELACERLTDADIDASDIEVKVERATVTLEGSVPVRWMKHAAEDIVDDLGGVKDIQNRLRVGRNDAAGAQTSAGTGTAPSPAGGASTGATGAGDIGGRSRH
jgi:hypothetical protein